MKRIKLIQGKFAIVDDDLYDELKRHRWVAVKQKHRWYAVRRFHNTTIGMSRSILGAKRGQICDHANGNSLDNQRHNLRFCTPSQNCQNRRKEFGGTSKYKGVFYRKERNKWRAVIQLNYKQYNLGHRDTEVECAKLYDKAAKKLFGEFACTNF